MSLKLLAKLDAFPKQREEAADLFLRTASGGIITLLASSIMILLFFSELGIFLRVETTNELTVDTSRGEQMLIHVDVTFPSMPCSWFTVDAMDASGEVHLDLDHDVYKRRLSASGAPLSDPAKHSVGDQLKVAPGSTVKQGANGTTCGSCYGAEDAAAPCCSTCEEVRAAYARRSWALLSLDHVEQCHSEEFLKAVDTQAGEGCHVWGDLLINKVSGNVHFAPGRSYQQGAVHMHDLAPFEGRALNFSHRIHRLVFGREYPGMRNPLDGVDVPQPAPRFEGGTGAFQYFVKVVPTSYTTLRNSSIVTNQYSVTESFKHSVVGLGGQHLPGVFFHYDLSPIKVEYREARHGLLPFLTGLCAIVGGVFTVSGIVDATVYHGGRALRKKVELGKLS